ncbi:MAG TPA: XdhC family protein [Verrucomicrobiae bacterium]|nr:XdhC family protein [Verrucomicrobiae bacterium]
MKEIYAKIHNLMQTNKAGALGTVVSGRPDLCPQGTKFLLDEQGTELLGRFDAKLLDLFKAPVQAAIAAKAPRMIESMLDGHPLKVFVDPIFPRARLVILGGGHIALPLVNLGKMLNYQVTVVDDRFEFANDDRFPEADQVVCKDFASAIREMPFDQNTHVIIVTRGHRHDKTCLNEILSKPACAYVGMIGSRRKVALLLEDLGSEGFSPEILAKVFAPVGLKIGAQTPEEIAVSIMAELIMVNRKGFCKGLEG